MRQGGMVLRKRGIQCAHSRASAKVRCEMIDFLDVRERGERA